MIAERPALLVVILYRVILKNKIHAQELKTVWCVNARKILFDFLKKRQYNYKISVPCYNGTMQKQDYYNNFFEIGQQKINFSFFERNTGIILYFFQLLWYNLSVVLLNYQFNVVKYCHKRKAMKVASGRILRKRDASDSPLNSVPKWFQSVYNATANSLICNWQQIFFLLHSFGKYAIKK